MGKRAHGGADADADGAAAFRKRQRISHDVPTGEEVTSGDQLRKLLAFDQDLGRSRHGLQSFKNLLDGIVAADGESKPKLAILQQYLEAVRPRDSTEDAVFLGDIMEMWSFATQVNNDGVMSSVVVVLALLLQVVSGYLQLVPYGLGVCQSLLQERQLKSLSRNLSSEKAKGFILSPTLRLLREAVCLDGGAYAKRIVRARNFTFISLGRNLEVGPVGDAQEDARKASVRTSAVRFFLSCLKYVHSDGKKELLSQKDLLSHLTFMMKTDPPYLVLEILDTLKSHVLMDDKIPREAKFRSFNTKALVRFLALYSYISASADGEKATVSQRAHEFLIYVCTTPGAGILYPSTGLYPKETDDTIPGQGGPNTDGDFVRDPWEGKFHDEIPVYNFVLSEFAGKLRPWSSLRHSELLVSIFTAAPELIADYFLNNRSFTFEPKLSMTWIGYAAFLFNTMSIPLPASFGDRIRYSRLPPPTRILLDNIIPLPITQKVLTRCLSPSSHLTSFFAMRILVVALEKLSLAITMHKEAPSSKTSKLWSEATRRLLDAFCQRIPDMKEIVRSYKSIPADNVLQKTVASRLLRLYYEVIPQVALAANFDVSPFFVGVLKRLGENSGNPGDRSLGHMELENLVSIASYSPGMRWFSKVENISSGIASSPFTALLRVLHGSDTEAPSHQLRKVLANVAAESQLVSGPTGLKPLFQALQCAAAGADTKRIEPVWAFLDNCINRCGTSPIKYLDLLKGHLKDAKADSEDQSVSLLAVTMVEQLPYATSSSDRKVIASIAKYLSLYFNALYASQDSDSLVQALHRKAQESLASSVKLAKLGDASQLQALKSNEMEVDEETDELVAKPEKATVDAAKLEEMLHVPFTDEEDTAALVKWTTKSVEDLVEDDWAAGLIRLLSSTHINIRKEAHTNILKMAAKIKDSSYEERDQIWLLLSELAESSKTQIGSGPAPSAFTAFAVHALDVLRNPLHPLYPKVNTYLTRSPVWSPEKLPLAHDVLHGEPSDDDRHYAELAWLLAYLLDALRTPFDLSVFHKKRWLEKLLALAANPFLRANLRSRLLRLVYRALHVGDGATTLITRFGALGWLRAQAAACEAPEERAVYAALMRLAWDRCDQGRVMAWSQGGARELVEDVSAG